MQKAIANSPQTADTTTINNLNKLASEYISIFPDSTLYYGQKAIDDARKINYSKGVANGLLTTANIHSIQGNYKLAEKNLQEAIRLFQSSNDLLGESNCYLLYGGIKNQTGKYQESLAYLNKALPIKLHIHDLPSTAKAYLELGNVYDNLGHSSTALDYYFKALNINTRLHNRRAMAANYNNIGVILQNMEIYPEALEYYSRALTIWKEIHISGGISTTSENVGEILLAQHKYNEAAKYLSTALNISQHLDDKDGLSTGYNHLGVCLLYQNQKQKALSYLEKALKIATDNQLNYDKATALTNIALYYNENQNFEKAYTCASDAKALANQIGSTVLRTTAYEQFIKALGGLQKYKDAFMAQKELNQIYSTSRQDASVQKFTSYNFEYRYADRQRQHLLQQRDNDLLYKQKLHVQLLINIIFVIIISAMVGILSVYYKQRHKQLKVNAKLSERNHEVLQQKVDLDEQAQKLNELNKLKDRLIAILAHDLRSPLSTLRGLFSLLEDEGITQEQFLEMVPGVVKNLEYTSDFLDTLLFWINSQMDTFTNSVKRFPIREVFNEVANYQEQALTKGIRLTENVQDGLVALSDPNSVRIVIRNLITNAIKFSRKDDTIEVSAAEKDQHILITIKDTGLGMSKEQCQNLFKNKVESKTGTQNESGTGMGLYFCKDMVENCNGEIWVESEEGVGTTFYFTVPMFVQPEEKADLVQLG